MGVNGPVKTVRTERVELALTDGKWVEGPRLLESLVTLDAEGRKVEQVYFEGDGTPRYKEVYTYASAAEWTRARYKADGELQYSVRFREQFDPSGKSSRLVIDGIDGKLHNEIVKKYDAEGRVIDALTYDSSNTPRARN